MECREHGSDKMVSCFLCSLGRTVSPRKSRLRCLRIYQSPGARLKVEIDKESGEEKVSILVTDY